MPKGGAQAAQGAPVYAKTTNSAIGTINAAQGRRWPSDRRLEGHRNAVQVGA